MKGDKMKYAKEAAKRIIENLTGEDFVSVVMYDHEVTLIQPATKLVSKDSIYKKIDAIEERGSTNLWGGSERGYEQVKKNYHPNYINRVLLISDGLANSGLTNSRVICNKVQQWKDGEGITLSTFGVGLDYNEVLMTDMAENGAGNYYFINDLNRMSSILEKELVGLNAIAAQNAQLKITLPPSVQLLRVYAIKPEIKTNVVSIQFRDLFSNETKGVLIQFRLNNGSNTDLNFSSILNYTDLADNKQKQVANENILSAIREHNTYITHFNRQVLEQTVLYKSNEALEKAMLEADRELFEGARLLLNKNQLYLKDHEALVQSSVELQKMQRTNMDYLKKLDGAEQMSGDSLKLIQKVNRQESYKIRNKRQ
jgi:Ca-activated chloride channel family protein